MRRPSVATALRQDRHRSHHLGIPNPASAWHRHVALLVELGLLDREIEKHFLYPEDLALAHIADAQGLGGHSGKIKH